jgi:hypothetical protein
LEGPCSLLDSKGALCIWKLIKQLALLLAGFQFGTRQVAVPFYMRTGFIKQNLNFLNSQELKVDQKIFKN